MRTIKKKSIPQYITVIFQKTEDKRKFSRPTRKKINSSIKQYHTTVQQMVRVAGKGMSSGAAWTEFQYWFYHWPVHFGKLYHFSVTQFPH